MTIIYLFIFLVLLSCQWFYFYLADRFNIIDKPNERSSHTTTTIRGGGIVFSLAVLIAFFMGYASWVLALAVSLVSLVSFVDDLRPLSPLPRFLIHLLASGLVIYEVGIYDFSLWWIPLTLFFLIGWINIFNFMDGINGITVLYALVTITSFALLPIHQEQFELLVIVGLSCLVFGYFNVRKKAKTFAGDVGSVAMALFLGYFMYETIVLTQNPFYLLFFTVYAVDGCFTILFRLIRRENIFRPHRSHLYQYLANEMKISHVVVSVFYALIQLGINLFLIYGVDMKSLPYVEGIVLVLFYCGLYLWVRNRVFKSVNPF